MPILITFIKADALGCSLDDNYLACRHICHDALIKFRQVIQADMLRKKSRGRVHPVNGFVMETAEGEILYNWMDLAKWIEKNGLKPC